MIDLWALIVAAYFAAGLITAIAVAMFWRSFIYWNAALTPRLAAGFVMTCWPAFVLGAAAVAAFQALMFVLSLLGAVVVGFRGWRWRTW